MPAAQVNNVEIAYERYGSAEKPVLLLIQGLGMPLSAWPPPLIEILVQMGFAVVVFDNRDVGHSQLIDAKMPNIGLQFVLSKLGMPVHAPYQLTDMMRDADSLLEHLGIAHAHVVGISMGGMIAQLLAIHSPQRVLSLTSIMSTTGNRRLPGPTAKVARQMFSTPASDSREDRMSHSIKTWQLIGSPDYPASVEHLVTGLNRIFERGVYPTGVTRQLLAILAAESRVEPLSKLDVPTLVIHGDADPLVPLAGGIDTAKSIPSSSLEIIAGMGHDLPVQLHEKIAGLIGNHVSKTERLSRRSV